MFFCFSPSATDLLLRWSTCSIAHLLAYRKVRFLRRSHWNCLTDYNVRQSEKETVSKCVCVCYTPNTVDLLSIKSIIASISMLATVLLLVFVCIQYPLIFLNQTWRFPLSFLGLYLNILFSLSRNRPRNGSHCQIPNRVYMNVHHWWITFAKQRERRKTFHHAQIDTPNRRSHARLHRQFIAEIFPPEVGRI